MMKARDILAGLASGGVSARATLDRVAARIAEKEADVRAFVHLDLDAARAAVHARGAELAALPLHGLPVAVKDIIDTADMPTGYGSPIHAGHRPAADAAVVTMLRRAGAIIPGKTVTTEFAYFTPGPTTNPAAPGRTPGGSSSGSAAAIAAGMVPAALGTQTAGSIVRPASYCGIAGFKPSFKLIPGVGVKPFSWHLDTVGLFAARISDVAAVAARLTGRDLDVTDAAPAPRFALVETHLFAQASPAARAGLHRAAEIAREAGCVVDVVALPSLFEEAWQAQITIMAFEAWHALGFEYDRHGAQLSEKLRAFLAQGQAVTPEVYDSARRLARRARHTLAELTVGADALLTLSAPGVAPVGLAATGDPMFNRLWTLIGSPCLNVPGLTAEGGLPLGIQVVGRFGRDKAALQAAYFLECAIQRVRAHNPQHVEIAA
jgi:Asp-tRNA(Asn)/Glu-tRNA(Gln) amidotransferase A subunit family amidase